MTKLEFVREVFGPAVNKAIDEMKDGKGCYRQYLDGQDHEIVINFEVIGNVIIGDITGEADTHSQFTIRKFDYRGYAKIEGTMFDAMIDLLLYASKVTKFYFPGYLKD